MPPAGTPERGRSGEAHGAALGGDARGAAGKLAFDGGGKRAVAAGVAQEVAEVVEIQRGDGFSGELRNRARAQELSQGSLRSGAGAAPGMRCTGAGSRSARGGNGNSYGAVSNPTQNASGETTVGWTRRQLDANGRVVEVQHLDGSGLPWPWGSNGNSTGTQTVFYDSYTTKTTDEAMVSRTSSVDGLGRVTQVVENGINATTLYFTATTRWTISPA